MYGSLVNPNMLHRSNSLGPQIPSSHFTMPQTIGSMSSIPSPPPNFSRQNTYTAGNGVYERAKQ
jgi:hypothetical protein